MQGGIISGLTAKRAMAKEMASHMWEPVRLSGVGAWERTGEGQWRIERMQVQIFEVLEDEDLSAVLARLRGLPVEWPDDAIDKLRDEREASL